MDLPWPREAGSLYVMRIAVVVKDFRAQRGGVERFAHQFVSQATKRGHELVVLAHRWNQEEGKRFSLHKVFTIESPSLAKLISFPLFARHSLEDLGPFDVVFGLTPLFSLDVYRIGEGIHREVLVRRYHTTLSRSWKRWGLKSQYQLWMEKRMFSLQSLQKIITISEASRRQLLTYYPVPEEKAITIYNGVDLGRFNPSVRERYRAEARQEWGIGEKEMAVLFVGNDFRRKGLMSLLMALSVLQERGMKMRGLIVGRDSPGPFARACEKLGIGKQIIFLGGMERVEKAYAGADLLVLPTHYDPFGFSCLEALACGLPVVTTRFAGAAEVIEEGSAGRVIPSPEPALIADAMGCIYKEGSWGEVNAEAWRIAQFLSLDKNTDAILSLFAQLRGTS